MNRRNKVKVREKKTDGMRMDEGKGLGGSEKRQDREG